MQPLAVVRWPLRLWHTYLGMLIAPSLLFFSASGAVQLFNLHEDHVGYAAPPVLVQVASLHKNQRLAGPPRHDRSDRPAPRYRPQQTALKIYWLAMCAAVVASTLVGIVMALRNKRQRGAAAVLLFVGIVFPLCLALV